MLRRIQPGAARALPAHEACAAAGELIAAAVAIVLAVLLSAAPALAAECMRVSGSYAEQVAADGCTSPAGLCLTAEYSGTIKGNSATSVTSFIPTADTAATGVLAFTADTTVHAKVHGREGDLLVKNAGAFRTVDTGDIVDVQVIVGGTGELAGASGTMRASGTFDAAAGQGTSDYVGNVCLP